MQQFVVITSCGLGIPTTSCMLWLLQKHAKWSGWSFQPTRWAAIGNVRWGMTRQPAALPFNVPAILLGHLHHGGERGGRTSLLRSEPDKDKPVEPPLHRQAGSADTDVIRISQRWQLWLWGSIWHLHECCS